MSYLSFLCIRLLDLRNETRAARVIQGAWRKYRLKKNLQLYKVGVVFAPIMQGGHFINLLNSSGFICKCDLTMGETCMSGWYQSD